MFQVVVLELSLVDKTVLIRNFLTANELPLIGEVKKKVRMFQGGLQTSKFTGNKQFSLGLPIMFRHSVPERFTGWVMLEFKDCKLVSASAVHEGLTGSAKQKRLEANQIKANSHHVFY